MSIAGKRILLTGATGGIGCVLAKKLAEKGALLGLVGRKQAALQDLQKMLTTSQGKAEYYVADLSILSDQKKMLTAMQESFSRQGDNGIDIVINCAGITDFVDFSQQTPERIEQVFKTNVIAPMQLVQQILPDMLKRKNGHVVNIGSTFGSIAFAWFSSYSASKFALRGFSEALRRELTDTGVKVSYIAPRAVKTALNSDAVMTMAKAVKMNMDAPEWVVQKVIRAIEKESRESYPGFPESLFVRINALFPWLVDGALKKQNLQAKQYMIEQTASSANKTGEEK